MSRARRLPLACGRRTTIARWLAVVGVVWVLLPQAALASGHHTTFAFDPDSDRTAWYWTKQLDGSAAGDPSGVPGTQAAGTLPVAMEAGRPEKISAVRFDLQSRGVPEGSVITTLNVSILEQSETGETPGLAASEPRIAACPISGAWRPAEADEWRNVPAHVEDACVTGVRRETERQTRWTFDLSSIAANWGSPIENRGFVLRGESGDGGATDTWQVNLKRPSEDDPATDSDEYDETQDHLTLSIAYSAPLPTPPPATSEPAGPQPERQLGTGRAEDSRSVEAPSPSVSVEAPSLGVSGSSPPRPSVEEPVVAVGPTPRPSPTSQDAQPVTATGLGTPKVPGEVWLLIPIGLLLLGILGWVVLEGDPQGRPLWMRVMGFENP